jgi:hypothetical protein
VALRAHLSILSAGSLPVPNDSAAIPSETKRARVIPALPVRSTGHHLRARSATFILHLAFCILHSAFRAVSTYARTVPRLQRPRRLNSSFEILHS